jgi:hypothetical protein
MARRFELEPCDEGFLAAAPKRYVGTFDIPKPAAEVWTELTRDGALDYCRMLRGANWTSPRPFGVGTTREMKVQPGLLVVDETFFIWDDGPATRRKAFYVTSTSLPMFRRLAEDYVVEETGPATCRFTWTIAGEPLPLARPGAPINGLLARSLFADTRRHFSAR